MLSLHKCDAQSHYLTCPEYSDLRHGLDLNKMDNLVIYFKGLLEKREKAENNGSGHI